MPYAYIMPAFKSAITQLRGSDGVYSGGYAKVMLSARGERYEVLAIRRVQEIAGGREACHIVCLLLLLRAAIC